MPRFIVKLPAPNGRCYLEWSTIVDAPITYGMTLDELKAHYQSEYGRAGMVELQSRLERVERRAGDVADVISGNRAGDGDSSMTLDELVDFYCVKRTGHPPRGTAK